MDTTHFLNTSGSKNIVPDCQSYFYGNRALAVHNRKLGVIDRQNHIILPFLFDKFEICTEDYIVLTAGDGLYVLDSNNAITYYAGHFIWTHIYDSTLIKVHDNNGYEGAIDIASGKTIPCTYSQISWHHNYWIIKDDNMSQGIFGSNFEMILDCYCKPSRTITPLTDAYFVVGFKKYERYGVANYKGDIIVPIRFNDVLFDDLKHIFICELGKGKDKHIYKFSPETSKYIVYSGDKIIQVPELYDDFYDFSEGLGRVHAVNKDKNANYCDINGNIDLFACMFDNFSFDDSKTHEKCGWGFINEALAEVIPCQYSYVGDFHNGLALVKDYSGCHFSYINVSGEKVIILEDVIEAGDFSCGLAQVQYPNKKWGYINDAGKLCIPAVFDEAEPFVDGRANVSISRKTGFYYKSDLFSYQIDMSGHMFFEEGGEMFDMQIDYSSFVPVGQFHFGLLVVRNNNHYGIIDRKGELLFPTVYKSISEFNLGEAILRVAHINHSKEYWGSAYDEIRINTKAEIIVRIGNQDVTLKERYMWAGRLGSSHIIVLRNEFGLCNNEGHEIIPCKYADMYLRKGYIIACDRFGDEYAFDYYGNKVDVLLTLEEVAPGLLSHQRKGKVGLFDKNYRTICECKYDDIIFYPNLNIGKVFLDGKCGIINKQGVLSIPCIYSEIRDFHEGRAITYSEGKYGVISDEGEQIISPRCYEGVSDFKNGRAEIFIWRLNDKYELKKEIMTIDKDGRLILSYKGEELFFSAEIEWAEAIGAGLFTVLKDGYWGCLDKSMNSVLSYCSILPIKSSYGLFTIVNSQEDLSVIDSKERVIVSGKYQDVLINDSVILCRNYSYDDCGRLSDYIVDLFSIDGIKNDTLVVKDVILLKSGHFAILKHNNWWISSVLHSDVSLGPYDRIGESNVNYVVVGRRKERRKNGDMKFGIIDYNGNLMIDYDYNYISLLGSNLAIVRQYIDYMFKYGILRIDGTEVCPCVYSKISKENNQTHLINATYCGLTCNLDASGSPVVWHNGQFHPIPDAIWCGEFHEGLCAVMNLSGVGFVDESFKMAIAVRDFGSAMPQDFEGSYCKVLYFNKSVFMNRCGQIEIDVNKSRIILPFEYTWAEPFEYDYIMAQMGAQCGLLKTNLEIIVPCQYESIYSLGENMVAAGNCDIIDLYNLTTSELIATNLSWAHLFKNGFAVVCDSNDVRFVINSNGEKIQCKDADMDLFDYEDEYEGCDYMDAGDYKSSYDSDYYNSDLDYDQQGADFWDDIL